ncbi:MAG: hypothetical protein AB1553_05375 [Nitrospirota bacterium]
MPVDIFSRKDKDYKIIPVSGVWGGLTPHGLVNCEFFIERLELPERIVVDEAGKEISQHPNRQYITREIMIGLMMRPEVARSVGEWLIQRAEEDERLRQSQK